MKNTEVHISTKTIIRFWVIVFLIATLVLAVYTARWAIILILTAIFLAFVLNRPTEFFARKLPGNNRALGAGITFLISLTVLVGTITLIFPILIDQTANFAKSLPDTIATLQDSSKQLNEIVDQVGLKDSVNLSLEQYSDQIGNFASSLGTSSVSFVSNFINGIGNAALVLVLTFFMLIEGPNWVNKFWKIAFKNPKKRSRYRSVGDKMYNVITGYVTSQLLAAAITGVLAGIGVFILSLFLAVPASLILPIAGIVFVAAFIPFFGGFIGAAIGTVLILLFSPMAALIFALYCAIFMAIFYNFFSPKIAGKFIQISALLVLVSLIIGMQIAGIFGALVAIPVTGCFVVAFREYIKHRDSK